MNKMSLIALLLFASGPWAQGAELSAASPRIAIELLDREIEETRELIRVYENSEAELAAARERLARAKEQFWRTHRVEPDFAADHLLEADGNLMSANEQVRKIQNISRMDKSYLTETLEERLDQRESLLRSLVATEPQPQNFAPSVMNSKSYAPKRSPAFVGGREVKAELVAPAE